METRNIEYSKIRQVAKDYEKNGYQVIIEPRGTDIPAFIKNYQPDIIAKSEKDNVVIEVKIRTNLATVERLKDTADIINKNENWRFELIVITSKQESKSEIERKNIDLEISEIRQNLLEVEKLYNENLLVPAFILGWANLESISRQLLLEDRKGLNNKAPLVLIKTLFSLGYLPRFDYQKLESLYQLRNLIIHGYKSPKLDGDSVRDLVSITYNLLIEKDKILNEETIQ